MQKKVKSRLASFFVVFICLLVFSLSLFFFWKNLNRMTVRSDIAEIGTIQFKYKIAQRKFVDRVAWERLQQNSTLYNGDTVRTADGATAQLRIGKTVIEVYESTMIQVFYNPETGLQMSVDNGDISIDTTEEEKNVKVAFSNGQEFFVETGSKLSVQSGDINNISVQNGIVNYQNENGVLTEISGGETVRISENGEMEKVPVTITSISENMRLLTFDQTPKNVLVQWRLNEASSDKVTVETYSDKEFKLPLNKYVVENETSVSLKAEVGRIYWKVYLGNDKDNYVSGKISVENVEPVKLLAPVTGKKYSNRNGVSDVAFIWKGNDFASWYLFELSSTPDFKTTVVSQNISTCSYNCSEIPEGTYYWRVTPYYTTNDIGLGKTLEAESFQIIRDEFEKPPVLSVPSENARITVYDTVSELSFIWKSFTDKPDYKLLIASDRNFNKVIYSAECSENKLVKQISSSDLPEGTYFWKVVSLSVKGDNGKNLESAVRQFSTVKYLPGENKLVYPPDNFSVEAKKINKVDFCWKIADEYKNKVESASIQISSTSDFRNLIVDKKVNDSQISDLSVPAGKYWWRLALKPSDSNLIYTKANIIRVLEELTAPVITMPAETVSLQKENTITIKWNPVSGADYYVVKVFDDKKVYANQDVNGNEFKTNIPVSLFENKNIVSLSSSVQAFAKETEYSALRSGSESVKQFNIKKPSKVVLKTPADAASIAGLTALNSSVHFEWNTDSDAKDVQFILKKMQPNGSMQVVKTVSNPGNSTSVSGLRSGSYEWTVKANSFGGLNLDSDQNFTFTVLPVPELRGARLIEPSPDQIIDGNYLVENKSVTFKWKKVTSATDYKFVLYQKLENGRLKKLITKNTKNTEFKITDLTSLDVGEFEWHVTAYVHSDDGEQQQKSRDSVGKFKISFEAPEEVNTIDPGILYGE